MPNDEKPPITPPDANAGQPEKAGGMEIPIPLDALASPGEDEMMNKPEVGDPISVYAEGKLLRIEGDKGIVTFKTVNGKPLDMEAAKTANTPEMDENPEKPDDEFEQLKSMAAMQPPR